MSGPSAGSPTRPVRVAQAVNNLHYGGLERVVQDLIRGFPPGAVENHLVLLEYEGRFAPDLADAAQIHLVPQARKLSMIYPAAVAGLLKRIQPDVLHTHSGVWFKAARAGRAAGVPMLVHTDHGRGIPDPFLHRLFDRMASRYTDTVVAVSDSVADTLRAGIVSRDRSLVVIPNGINTDQFRPRHGSLSLRASLGIPEGVPLIGSIGRLEPIKNYGLAVRALAQLLHLWDSEGEEFPMLLLAGDGSERGRLAELADSLGVGHRVRFLGWRDDVHALFDTFDLFTLSSRSEGTSMSLLEAMSSGLPCVVTDVGGNRAVLGQALESALVPSEDADALARAWHRSLLDPDGRRSFGQRARCRAVESYSARLMAERYLALYRNRQGPAQSPDTLLN